MTIRQLPLRAILLLGMLFHKALWEAMKRDESEARGEPSSAARAREKAQVSPVKVAKVAILAGLLAQTAFLDVFQIGRGPARTIRTAGLLVYLAGLATAIAGRLQLGDNWANIEEAQVLPGQKVVSRGIYGLIRHPIYAGDLLLVLGLQLALNSWLALGALPLFGVVVRRARAEERLLAASLPGYDEYRRRTRMLIPGIF